MSMSRSRSRAKKTAPTPAKKGGSGNPGYYDPGPCTTQTLCNATVLLYVVLSSGISQAWLHSASRTNAATSHFKLNQVIETRVTSSIPYPCPPVAGLQDWATSLHEWLGGRNQPRDAEHVKLWHYTWANRPTKNF